MRRCADLSFSSPRGHENDDLDYEDTAVGDLRIDEPFGKEP